MNVDEINVDGLVGPTHHYAGLAYGNLASEQHAKQHSYPRQAAQQSLDKMRLLMRLGVKQAIMPPQQRPNLALLQQLGFHGSPEKRLRAAYKESPELFAACYSASSMWMANAATVSPSLDSQDACVHITPANLQTYLHRQQEMTFHQSMLKKIFPDENLFKHHFPLPHCGQLADEGAANHMRLCASHEKPGVNIFVYGRHAFSFGKNAIPKRYPARQSDAAAKAIVRLHQLNEKHVVLAKQNPEVIDQGVFHNDVIAMSNGPLLICHQHAFVDTKKVIDEVRKKANFPLQIMIVTAKQVSVEDAVASYLFNSQLVSLADGSMALIAPLECQQYASVVDYIEQLLAEDNMISEVHYVDCRQSMHNGGGPACLRLRMALTSREQRASHAGIYLDESLCQQLQIWLEKYYPEQLSSRDLLDVKFIEQSYVALDELTNLLKLGSIYPFQQEKSSPD